LDEVDRAKTRKNETGHIKIITTRSWEKVVGVSILASRGGEILPEFQTMIQDGRSIV
jgi:pyruvate/2-oxoglutarate dehydrogenase complex dihydrolipoamide dehydrogenase (E3) component